MMKKTLSKGLGLLLAALFVLASFTAVTLFNGNIKANAAEFGQADVVEHTKPIPFSDEQILCGAPKWNATESGVTYTENGGYGGAANGKGTIYTTFGGVYAKNFIVSAELQAPSANDKKTGFFFRAKKEVIPGCPNQDSGAIFTLYNNGSGIYILQEGNVGGGTAAAPVVIAGATASGKEVISFSVEVNDTNAIVTAKQGANAASTMTVAVANIQSYPETGFNYAGFVTSDEGTTISKIAMANGKDETASGYKRFGCYGATSVGLSETEYTALNKNMTEYAGDMVQTSQYLKANSLHGSLSRTITFSKFGKGYGTDFDGEFEVKAPLGTESSTGGNNAGAGMFFRSTQAMESSKGIYIVLENEKTKADEVGKLALKIYAVNSGITSGSNVGIDVARSEFEADSAIKGNFVKIKFSIKANVIKANAYTDGGTVSVLKAANAETGITATTTQVVEATQTSGFYSVNFLPTYKNIILTNKTTGANLDKTFEAYPFNAESVIGTTDNYELYSPNAVNFKTGEAQATGVAISQESKDAGELHLGGETPHDDGGLIGIYSHVFYFRYSATANKILARKIGTEVESIAEYEMNNGPDFSWAPYKDYVNVNRHAYAAIIYNEHGYVASRVEGVIHVLPKKVSVSNVTATSRTYDTTRAVELKGGTLNGTISGEDVTLNLGKGSVNSANVGNDYVVTTNIQLAGKDAGNYLIAAQPTDLKVNIAKGKMEKPAVPEIEAKTETSITVTEIFGAEYSLDGTKWQDTNVFLDLKPGIEYTVYTRIKGNANADTSDASEGVKVTTEGNAERGGCGSIISQDTLLLASIIVGLFAVVAFIALRKKRVN